jgi:DNA-3-methyladenine glycosylase II
MTSKAKALRHFRRVDPHFFTATRAHHHELPDELPIKRTRAQLVDELASTIVSQQLSTKAAKTVCGRLKATCRQRITPTALLALSEKDRKEIGLSQAKLRSLKDIAHALETNRVDLLKLKSLPENEIIQILLTLRGIGSWTAEMFLMFGLGKHDVFSPGDLGLMRSIEALYHLPRATSKERVVAITERWAPYRSFASLLLWRVRDASR